MRYPRALATVVMLVLVTACGSTVPPSSTQSVAPGAATSGGTSGGGLGIPSGGTAQGGAGAGGSIGGGSVAGGSSSGGSSSGSAVTGFSGGGGSGAAGAGGSTAASGAAPGITATTIYIGAGYTKNREEGNAAIGGGGAGGGDARDSYNVMIEEINKNGGIAGRKIVPIYYGLDATSSQTADEQAQAECAHWTQDNEVFAILAGQFPITRQCAKKAGAVEFWSPVGSNSLPETFREYPHYVEITGLNMVRLGPVTIDGLAAQGYFDKGAKIGLVAWDDPAYREAVEKGFIPALADKHLRLATDPVYIHAPANIQDLGNSSADVNNAVLKFASEGIDHVMLLDGPIGVCAGACLGFEFLNRAKSQQYFPRYGFNENNQPAAALKAGLYPADELRRSAVVSWADHDDPYDAGWHKNATREACEALMRKHGVDMSSENARVTALAACEELSFMKAVVEHMGNLPLTPDNFMRGVDALGGDFPSTITYATNFGPAQHDGIAAVRNMHFVNSCTCYKYTSAPYRP